MVARHLDHPAHSRRHRPCGRRLAVLALLILPTGCAEAPRFERFTVASLKNYRLNLYPAIARLPAGRLLCAFSAQDPVRTGGRPVLCASHSDDGGRTWSSAHLMLDAQPEQVYDPQINVIGRRVVLTSTVLPPAASGKISTSRTLALDSEDGGLTWSAARELPMPHRYTCGKIHRGITLRDGTAIFGYSWDTTLEHPSAAIDAAQAEGHAVYRCGLMRSHDGGRTWAPGPDVGIETRKPAGDRTRAINGLDEPAFVECSDGSLFMLCRTGLERFYETRSADGGRSWSEPGPSNIVSHNAPASLCRITRPRPAVVAVWCNSPVNRWPLCAAASFDDCRTWTAPRCLAAGDGREVSYPGTVQAADGMIVAVWREQLAAQSWDAGWEIHGARFNLSWLTQPSANDAEQVHRPDAQPCSGFTRPP